ncbi:MULTISPECIES: amino acid ABC transporter ATP-binding protein [Agrobacterium]|uniref:Amino acid ABC transporter ATP-binding protein n=1 Tax=Agrobacterium rosae TaxID=1972867 RepID=A0A1R3TX73_9HYPH|nr:MULTISPECIES: amino acid ABC transporter ATP-binding protein [Agrobacterium]MDX8303853.1 amino acid ABC transporter ATP-binding protein [Agrobacterium rosae]MDX8313970.1 amino acid ABC transporter ATP-binding protein [Agrobacterium rosae]POO55321.1 amino acid ABC transporter ATP-binding protein [Agrobacterium rosae]SCX10808.1 Glutamine transport ATP-binding protein GlnQ [Agrobacterium sp. DSM 25558]SCX22968.1 Glutamine transport ATP-binding protein GlnQ [Agrobacterium rosae]
MTASTDTAIVKLEDVHLSFGNTQVLKGIDLTVNKGDAVSIIGPSGSGKSTLLRCINALAMPQSGRITVARTRVDELTKESERIELRKRVGIVFQQYNLFPHLTVLDNIVLAPTRILGANRTATEKLARELLEKVRLSEKADAYPGQLSGGQQQRVAIARALAMKPELVLFDEVTSALDPETVGEVLWVIRDLIRDGMTSILVTHEMRFAEEISDTVVFTENGRIVAHGSPKEIFHDSDNSRIRQFVSGLSGARASIRDGEGI